MLGHDHPVQRRTDVFVVSLRRPRARADTPWRLWVHHVASGADALVLEAQDLASFVNSCLGVTAFSPGSSPGCPEQHDETTEP